MPNSTKKMAVLSQLSNITGAWPNDEFLKPFTIFCQQSYAATKKLIADALPTN